MSWHTTDDDRWEAATQTHGRSCRDCVHDGCCDGLPHCGGSCFNSRWVECDRCGNEYDGGYMEEVEDEDGTTLLLCESCYSDWEEEQKEAAKEEAQ